MIDAYKKFMTCGHTWIFHHAEYIPHMISYYFSHSTGVLNADAYAAGDIGE